MPIMDGAQSVKIIRELEKAGDCGPVVVVSLSANVREVAVNTNFDEVLWKPLSRDKLAIMLRRIQEISKRKLDSLKRNCVGQDEDVM